MARHLIEITQLTGECRITVFDTVRKEQLFVRRMVNARGFSTDFKYVVETLYNDVKDLECKKYKTNIDSVWKHIHTNKYKFY